MTTRQRELLQPEFKAQNAGFDLFTHDGKFELDGPAVEKSLLPSSPNPSVELAALISTSHLCVSDNLIWPAAYANRFILMANFLWSDYWQARVGLDPAVESQRELEKLISGSIKARYANDGLSWTTRALLPVSHHYGLLRYPSDRFYEQLVVGRQAWLSGGTTGLFGIDESRGNQTLSTVSPQVVRRETWKMTAGAELPWAIFGRPGIGTIRDSMSAGVPFYGVGYDIADPELRVNSRFASDFFDTSPCAIELGNDDLLNSLRTATAGRRLHYLEKWKEVSESPEEIMARLLDSSP